MQSAKDRPCLLIAPSVPVWANERHLIFDRKFYDGIMLYLKYWGGPVTCVMRRSHASPPAFGLVEKNPDELPFKCITLKDNKEIN